MSKGKMAGDAARDGRVLSLGWFRSRPSAWISLDAELVALGIRHDAPVLPGSRLGPGRQVPRLLLDRPQIQESAHLAVDLGLPVRRGESPPAADVQIQVDPILPRLRRVQLLEVDPRTLSLGIDNRTRGVPLLRGHPPCLERRLPRRKPRGRVLQLVMERFGPELRQAIRIGGVEHDLSLGCHDRFPVRPHRPMAYLRDGGRAANRAGDSLSRNPPDPSGSPHPPSPSGTGVPSSPRSPRTRSRSPAPTPRDSW